jgi:hypothetical protein
MVAELPSNKILFLGDAPLDNVPDLWVYDGTAAGTHPLAFDDAGKGVAWLTAASTRVFFATGTDPSRLWVTDGTPAGTFPASAPSPDPQRAPLALSLDRLLFVDAYAHSFWVTDGTVAGTFPLLDPNGQRIDATRQYATRLHQYLVFASLNGTGPCQVWDSFGDDPTVDPIEEVACASRFQRVGNRLFFAGFEPSTGTELWVLEEK